LYTVIYSIYRVCGWVYGWVGEGRGEGRGEGVEKDRQRGLDDRDGGSAGEKGRDGRERTLSCFDMPLS
jgi:hypothetical protein